jgi:hypothetical protein
LRMLVVPPRLRLAVENAVRGRLDVQPDYTQARDSRHASPADQDAERMPKRKGDDCAR